MQVYGETKTAYSQTVNPSSLSSSAGTEKVAIQSHRPHTDSVMATASPSHQELPGTKCLHTFDPINKARRRFCVAKAGPIDHHHGIGARPGYLSAGAPAQGKLGAEELPSGIPSEAGQLNSQD